MTPALARARDLLERVDAFMAAEVYFLSREEVTGENKNAQPLLLTNPAE